MLFNITTEALAALALENTEALAASALENVPAWDDT